MQDVPDGYFLMEPRENFPGCLGVLLHTKNFSKYLELEAQNRPRRYRVRALVSDHISLTGEVNDLVSKPSDALVFVNGNPLTINLDFPHYLPVFYDLVPASDGKLSYVEVEVEARHPIRALAPARTAVNQLLDTLMRVGWVPLIIMRMDSYLEDEAEPFIHQLLLPFTHGLSIGPLGGFGSFPKFAPYEALLREAIVASSPYYRFLCSFKLFEGVNTLRFEIRKFVERFSINERMPRPRLVERSLLRNLGFKEEFCRDIKTIEDLLNAFRAARNAIAHFLIEEAAGQPLHISNGDNFRFYAMAGAALLHYSNLAVSDLMLYFNQHVYSHVARGTILIMTEDRARCIIKAESFWRTQQQTQDLDEEDEEEMARPMFIQINSGRKVEFINTAHISRIEVIHPDLTKSEPGSGKLFLEDGTERELGENEITWLMRMMPDLLGSPALGTQDPSPGYWSGKQQATSQAAAESPSQD